MKRANNDSNKENQAKRICKQKGKEKSRINIERCVVESQHTAQTQENHPPVMKQGKNTLILVNAQLGKYEINTPWVS